MKNADTDRVFAYIPNGADIHGYRSDYANELYKQTARKVSEIPTTDMYICRDDLKGVIYDKKAMAEVSRNLGHNRISVIAEHYLKTTK